MTGVSSPASDEAQEPAGEPVTHEPRLAQDDEHEGARPGVERPETGVEGITGL